MNDTARPTPATRSPRSAPRVGVMGGTFDPIHLGHLVLAEQARTFLNLDQVLFVPAGQPWRKAGRQIASVAHRVAMVAAALEGDPYFTLSTVESELPRPSYTADTLALLRRAPEPGPDAELFFILGLDALLDLPNWHDPGRIVAQARLAVATREGWTPGVAEREALERAVPGIAQRIAPVPMPRLDISSTDIRARVAAGRSIRFLVPAAVDSYIQAQGLYRA